MLWILDHLPDIESDLSAIHGIHIDIDEDDYGGLSGPRFFRLVWRLPAYEGVLQAFVLNEAREERERHGGVKPIPLTPEMAQQTSVMEGLGGLIDWQ